MEGGEGIETWFRFKENDNRNNLKQVESRHSTTNEKSIRRTFEIDLDSFQIQDLWILRCNGKTDTDDDEEELVCSKSSSCCISKTALK